MESKRGVNSSSRNYSEERSSKYRSQRQQLYQPGFRGKQNLEFHKCSKLPLQINYAFKAKYTSPIRKEFIRYVASQYDLSKYNENMLLEEYGKKEKLKYKESNDINTRTMMRQQHVGMNDYLKKIKQKYQTPDYRYFKLNESDVKQEDIDKIFGKKQEYKQEEQQDDWKFKKQRVGQRKRKDYF